MTESEIHQLYSVSSNSRPQVGLRGERSGRPGQDEGGHLDGLHELRLRLEVGAPHLLRRQVPHALQPHRAGSGGLG